jgi:hypothetical protein
VTMADDTALPTWITWNSASPGTGLSIKPVDGAVKASNPWNIKVVYTPDAGSNTPTYTAVSITVTCEITSFTVASTPAN